MYAQKYNLWKFQLIWIVSLTLTSLEALLLNNENPSKSNNCLCCLGS